MSARHFAKVLDWRSPYCGAILTSADTLPTSNPDAVECTACLAIMAEAGVNVSPDVPVHFIHRGVQWHQKSSAPYKCGALGDEASTNRDDVTCSDCLALMGGGTSTPRQKPPYMNEKDDGIFEFYDVDYYAEVPLSNTASMEVVPQATGNVEITLTHDGDGTLFTLSHLDRADLLRALLHEFHYSPERGGPNDEAD